MYLQVKSSFKPEREPSDDDDDDIGDTQHTKQPLNDHHGDIDDLLDNGPPIYESRDDDIIVDDVTSNHQPKKSKKKKSHKHKHREVDEPSLISFDEPAQPSEYGSSGRGGGYGSTGTGGGYGSTGGTVVKPTGSSNVMDDWGSEDWGSWTQETSQEPQAKTKVKGENVDAWDDWGNDSEWSTIDLKKK